MKQDPDKNSGRYSRQILFDGIGSEGQASIASSRVVLVGCGALGTLQASLLVRAGVGTVRLIDRDFVEESNLQRQILFDESDVRALLPKAVAAARKLCEVNSLVSVEGVVADVNRASAGRLLDGFDLILDASDNFDVRFLINDYAVKNRIPWIYGACVGAAGMMFTIVPGETACLRCVFESAPPAGITPTCDTAGVIGPAASMVASLQVAEALKILAGQAGKVNRRITRLDLWENRITMTEPPVRDESCPCCGNREFFYLEGAMGAETSVLCGRNSVQISRSGAEEVDLQALAAKLTPVARIEGNRFLMRAVIDGYQLTVFADGRAIVAGTNDPSIAKSLYARYVGA